MVQSVLERDWSELSDVRNELGFVNGVAARSTSHNYLALKRAVAPVGRNGVEQLLAVASAATLCKDLEHLVEKHCDANWSQSYGITLVTRSVECGDAKLRSGWHRRRPHHIVVGQILDASRSTVEPQTNAR